MLMRPVGISRDAVRAFFASKRESTRRLNPIAAPRAVTMHPTIQITRCHSNPTVRAASSAPTRANGNANTEWLNRINDAYVRRRDHMKVRMGAEVTRRDEWRL